MRFSRAFRTCDSNDMNITAGTIRVIAAYGADDTIAYHRENHFTQSINLLRELPVAGLSSPKDSVSYNITMNNYTVPAQPTTYGCAFVPLPNVNGKHHIYKIEPLIQAGNELLVHHILLYACPNNTNISIAPGECYNTNPLFFQCLQVINVWAVGGKAFQFPDNVGLSIGSPDDPSYARLEIHYNNPEAKNFTDSSGVQLYYTKDLRPYNAGILEIGSALSFLFIPPSARSFRLYGLCNTQKFPEVNGQQVADMQVFAYQLHTHLAGRAVRVAHYRNGSQIGFLGRDMTYDFNFQEVKYLENITTIKMGDALQVECTYNTMDRRGITEMGLGTMNEMCMAFLFYYPKNNVSHCLSSPSATDIMNALHVSNPKDVNSVEWDENKINLLQQTIQEGKQDINITNSQIHLFMPGSFVTDTGYLYNITEGANATCNNATFSSLAATSAPNSSMTPAMNEPNLNNNGSGSLRGSVILINLALFLFQAALGASLRPPNRSP
nr:DBH-like monooxygenase protein 2 isoform X3 [Geotrypetes seraphini]